MKLHLLLCLAVIVPAVVLAIQGAKDRLALGLAIAAAVIAAILLLEPEVDVLADIINKPFRAVLAVAALGCGIGAAIRLKQQLLGGILGTAGVILAGSALDIID